MTYNLVLTCAVESLRDRYTRRGMDLSHINIEDAIAPEPAVTPREPGGGNSSAEIEKVLACICSRAYTKTCMRPYTLVRSEFDSHKKIMALWVHVHD